MHPCLLINAFVICYQGSIIHVDAKSKISRPASFYSWAVSWPVGCKLSKTCEPRLDKTNKVSVCPAKTQISLGIPPVWSESLLCAQWVAKDPRFLHADSEDSDQTGRMPRLIWVFAGRISTLLVLSYRGSCFLMTWFIYMCMSVVHSRSFKIKLP